MTNPYQVLGVPTTATDDEVKKAYRQLAKRYHPDANPGDASAERRMKEINAAYEQIMDKDNNAGAQGGYGGGAYNPFTGAGYSGRSYTGGSAQNESPQMRAAQNYLQYGLYSEALNALSGIRDRTARWYYYSAQAHAGLGNRAQALRDAQQAVYMDPNNLEYRLFLQQVQNPARTYTNYGRRYTVPDIGANKFCLGLCLAQLFVRLCCRF